MGKTKRNLLIFLCGLVFLTVVAVLVANFIPEPGDTTKDFAKWGSFAVLGEILALFVLVTRTAIGRSASAFTIVLDRPREAEWADLNVKDIVWDEKKCIMLLGNESIPITPAHMEGSGDWVIKLSSDLYGNISETDVIDLILVDDGENIWNSKFYLHSKQVQIYPRPVEIVSEADPDSGVGLIAYRGKLRSSIDGLDAAKAKALITDIKTEFPSIIGFVALQYPDDVRDGDADGSKAKKLLKRLVSRTAKKRVGRGKWQAAIDNL